MAKTWADLTPDEALALRNRIERAMTIGDEAAADLARRRQEALFRPKGYYTREAYSAGPRAACKTSRLGASGLDCGS